MKNELIRPSSLKNLRPRTLILGFVLVFALCLVLTLLGLHHTPADAVAKIYHRGELLEEIKLSQVQEAYEIPLRTDEGENIILVEPGQISMQSASCPDQVCVHRGIIKSSAYPIVCLPHEVVIEIVDHKTSAADAVTF